MEFIKPDIHINFVGVRKIAFILSGTMILLSFILLIARGAPTTGSILREASSSRYGSISNSHRMRSGMPSGQSPWATAPSRDTAREMKANT